MKTKLNLESKDIIDNNIELISQLFPHCITEQDGKKVVDFNKLKNEFTDEIVDEEKEKYELNWPGKRAAINEARIKTNKTLLPLEEKSINFEDTNNVYIEGDNLEVLKLLQESYLNKIKCIYIDPPYNTGKDFIYKDDFKQTSEKELIESGQIDKDGNKFVQNTESNGRYHSDWLSMMYPRLKLARNLLTEDGIIFISIDDNEYSNLKKVCDEIFGESNFLGDLIRKTKSTTGDAGNGFNMQHEYTLIYHKSFSSLVGEEKDLTRYKNPDNDPKGPWVSGDPSARTGYTYDIVNPITGKIDSPPSNREWSFPQSRFEEFVKTGKIIFKNNHKETERGFIFKRYKNELSNNFAQVNSLFAINNEYMNQSATKELASLFDTKVFDYAKPTSFANKLVQYSTSNDDIVLDFFSGSSTMAHAVITENSRDNGNRKYIMVQLPETIDEKNSKSAYDFCIENDLEPIIPSIAQERIKRAGAKIKEETGADIDYGFRVFKLSDSILKANEVLPSDLQQDLLSESDSKYVDGISKLDIVTSVILDLGLMLDSKIENIGNDNFIVEEDLLFISLSEEYDNSVLDSIRDIMPDQVVLDEKTFGGNDALMTNVIQQINEINSDITINIL